MSLVMHRFDNVEVDADLHEVRIDGAARSIEPQVLSVLTYLIDQRHRVVPKEELLDEVWGSRFISAAAITSRIKSARQAIGDSGREQRCIRTVHGRGYRFVADVEGAPRQVHHERGASLRPPSAPRGGASATRRSDDGWPLAGREAEAAAIRAAVEGSEACGVLLTGPAGVGKTRLARAVTEQLEQAGRPVARINGHSEAAAIPLAALGHLLPADIADAAELRGDLARTILLERARIAIEQLAGDHRLILMIDDIDQVDSLSLALLGSLISSASVAAIMTQRDAGTAPVFEHLIDSGPIRRFDLGPLQPDQLANLLASVLDGPVRPDTSSTLVAAAAGNPGMLRQLVESSRAASVLERRAGVWLLSGPIAASADLVAVIEARLIDLDPTERDAAELIALAGELPLDLAFELVDDEILDALELAGMLSVRDVVREPRVRLAHPLIEEVLRGQIPVLRVRLLRQRLADGLAEWITRDPSRHPADRLRLVRLRLDSDGELDEEMALESAQLSLLEGDASLSGRILGRLQPADPGLDARARQLRAEGMFLQGQFLEAGAILREIDIERLDADDGAFVVRRIATSIFYGHWRQRDATDYLSEHFERFSGPARATLEAYWVMLAALDGRDAAGALERGHRLLDHADGFVRLETLAGMAMAHFVRGELDAAIELTDEFDRDRDQMPRSLTWAGPDYAQFVQITTRVERGEIDEAWRVVDRSLEPGAVPSLGFLSIGAGRLAVRSGRPEQALTWLTPLVQLADAIGLTTNARPMQATTARAALALGDNERARLESQVLEAQIDDEWSLVTLDIFETILRIEASTGDTAAAAARMIEAAGIAKTVGNTIMEASLLGAAVEFGCAAEAVDRLVELVDIIDDGLVGLKLRHARAALTGSGLDEVARDYDRIGLHLVADAVRATPL